MEVDSKEPCKYGVDCYQRNENHHKRFSHPPKPPNSPATSKSPEQKRKLSPESAKLSETCEENSKKFKATNLSEPSRSLESEHQASSNDNETLSDPIENEEEENGDLLQTSKLFIKEKFLFDMPEDFYAFWEFCVSQSKGNQKPEEIFKKFGLNLVGPFDVLAGKFNEQNQFEPEDYLRHWRYYYDPPEFQVRKSNKCDNFVFSFELFLVHRLFFKKTKVVCITVTGEMILMTNASLQRTMLRKTVNLALLLTISSWQQCMHRLALHAHGRIFGFNRRIHFRHYLDEDLQLTPFNRPSALAMKKSLENFAKERNICVDVKEYLNNLKARNVKTVCKTFHRAGLIVAFNRKTTVGYRPLIETEG